MKKLLGGILIGGLIALTGQTHAGDVDDSTLKETVKSIMEMKHRDKADKKRDKNRRPEKAIPYFGLKQNMTVVEFGPGSGWYTKILAPLLEENGTLYLASKQEWLDKLDPVLKKKGMKKAKKLPLAMGWSKENRAFDFQATSLGVSNVDMVLNIREYHGFDAEGKVKFNRAAFNALKPGGTYVVIDHTRRHMQPDSDEVWRREDPVKVISEVQNAGFVLEKYSDMFYRPDDELRYEVGRKTVTGNTDRFFLVFKKPE